MHYSINPNVFSPWKFSSLLKPVSFLYSLYVYLLNDFEQIMQHNSK